MGAVSLAGLTLDDPDGEVVPIERLFEHGDNWPRWLVIQALRYYGWLPCQAYLVEVRERLNDLETAGARFVAVAPQAPYQAAYLRDERGITDIPLLLDPEHRLRERVGLGKLSLGGLLSPRGALNYVRAVGRGRRPGRIRGYNLQPGVILANRNLDVVRTWIGSTYGDYPQIDQVLTELRSRRH